MNDNKLDCVVCGIGSIGTRHVNNLLTHFPDKKIGLLRRHKISYKNLPVFSDFDECIQETEPKYIFICTPNSKHIDIAIKAARKAAVIRRSANEFRKRSSRTQFTTQKKIKISKSFLSEAKL